jgi:hypothetical protein
VTDIGALPLNPIEVLGEFCQCNHVTRMADEDAAATTTTTTSEWRKLAAQIHGEGRSSLESSGRKPSAWSKVKRKIMDEGLAGLLLTNEEHLHLVAAGEPHNDSGEFRAVLGYGLEMNAIICMVAYPPRSNAS